MLLIRDICRHLRTRCLGTAPSILCWHGCSAPRSAESSRCYTSRSTFGRRDSISTSGNRAKSARTNAERLTLSRPTRSVWASRPVDESSSHPQTIVHAGTTCGPTSFAIDRSASMSTSLIALINAGYENVVHPKKLALRNALLR